MTSDAIWSDLELQRKNENKDSKFCILKVFETIWNCRDHFETMPLTHALGHYLEAYIPRNICHMGLMFSKQVVTDPGCE